MCPPVYRFLKQYDLKAFRRENRKVDSYVVLTEPMTEDLQVGQRPYCVVEGIYEPAAHPPAEKAQRQDSRIRYLGQVSSAETRQVILEGDVLVNPRKNDSDYTKYSFPSKIIDYLATGNPVVAYRLDGMSAVYGEFIHYVEDDRAEALRRAIRQALGEAPEQSWKRSENALRYLTQELSKQTVAEKFWPWHRRQNRRNKRDRYHQHG